MKQHRRIRDGPSATRKKTTTGRKLTVKTSKKPVQRRKGPPSYTSGKKNHSHDSKSLNIKSQHDIKSVKLNRDTLAAFAATKKAGQHKRGSPEKQLDDVESPKKKLRTTSRPGKAERLLKKNRTVRSNEVSTSQYIPSGWLNRFAMEMRACKTPWWELRDLLLTAKTDDNQTKMMTPPLLAPIFHKTKDDCILHLQSAGRNLFSRLSAHVSRQEMRELESAWARKLVTDGLLKDKFGALVELINSNPLVHLDCLTQLFDSCAPGKNRTEVLGALRAFSDVWCGEKVIPGDVQMLKSMYDYSDIIMSSRLIYQSVDDGYYYVDWDKIKADDNRFKLLMLLTFEALLQELSGKYVTYLATWAADSVTWIRGKVLQFIFEVAATKPNNEDELLKLLVRGLSDTESAVNIKASEFLARILLMHGGLKLSVCKKLVELMKMQKVTITEMFARGNSPGERRSEYAKVKSAIKGVQMRMKTMAKDQGDKVMAPVFTGSNKNRMKRAYRACFHATKFLAGMLYTQTDPPELVTEILEIYKYILENALKSSKSIYEKALTRRKNELTDAKTYLRNYKGVIQSDFAKRKKGAENVVIQSDSVVVNRPRNINVTFSNDDDNSPYVAVKAAGVMFNYLHGLAFTASGAQIMTNILRGLRRLIPYVPKDTRSQIFQLNGPLVRQLWAYAHQGFSATSRLSAWGIMFNLVAELDTYGITVFSNFYSQLFDYKLYACRGLAEMQHIICNLMDADRKTSATLDVRVAIFRRFLAASTVMCDQPNNLVSFFDAIQRRLSVKDPKKFKKWITDTPKCSEPQYDHSAFNPAKSNSLNTPLWESHFASTSIFTMVHQAASKWPTNNPILDSYWIDAIQPDDSPKNTNRRPLIEACSLKVLYKLLKGVTIKKALRIPDEEKKRKKLANKRASFGGVEDESDEDDDDDDDDDLPIIQLGDSPEPISSGGLQSITDPWTLRANAPELWKPEFEKFNFPFRPIFAAIYEVINRTPILQISAQNRSKKVPGVDEMEKLEKRIERELFGTINKRSIRATSCSGDSSDATLDEFEDDDSGDEN